MKFSDVPLKMGNHVARDMVRDLPTNLFRALKRKTRRFNAIPRAEKAIDRIQENPARAPIHEATQKVVEQLMKEHPEKLDELTEKNENLHKHLENVYVKSTGENTQIFSRKKFPDSYGYRMMRTREPDDNVPEGRFNSTRAEHFLAAHERDPVVYSPETLADVYKVDADAMKNIVEYVKIYSVTLPVKKTKGPGAVQQMAQDLIPGGLYEEPEFRVLERKIELAKNRMAKIYQQEYKMRDKLMYDMPFFESLIALKPMVKKVKDDLIGGTSLEQLKEKSSDELIFTPESKDETADIPKDIKDDSFIGKTKEKLIKYGVLETQEEILRERKADKIREELQDSYLSVTEEREKHTTISTPEMEKEEHFALETQKQLENIFLLEDKKKENEKNDVKLISSNDSTELKDTQSDDQKTQYKEKMSDKG